MFAKANFGSRTITETGSDEKYHKRTFLTA